MDPEAPLPGAVWAQECYEAEWKLNPVNLLRFAFSAKARRGLEIIGHEIETQAAVRLYRRNEADYREKEAQALKAYTDFRGMGAGQIKRAMEAKRGAAARWVADNLERIKAHGGPLPRGASTR